MSQQAKKSRERFFVERAAKLLDKQWNVGPDTEHPDFIIEEGTRRFGIEVSEIFTGRQSRKGSYARIAECKTQKRIDALRHAYEEAENISLTVKFVGDLCPENMAAALRELVGMDLPSRELGYRHKLVADAGPARLSAYVMRTTYSNWYSVNDRAGFVDTDPIKRIAEEVGKKAEKLGQYKRSSGLDDIRLLLVANRIMNSGKMSLEKSSVLDVQGFRAVYFLSYPESVTVFL